MAELPDCLLAAGAEHYYSSSLLAAYSLLATPPPAAIAEAVPGWQQLTTCERRVLRELVGGHSRQETANLLFLSPRTVDNHKAGITAKLNVSGGPYSLARFLVLHKDELVLLLGPKM